MTADAADAAERFLKLELMRVDIVLKGKQAFWETPRNLAIVLTAFAAVVGAGAGFVGYRIGQTPAPAPVVIYVQGPPAPAPAPAPR